MGIGTLAVVVGEMRVHGLKGLLVFDASVFPKIVSGNLNAPTQMIGERAADFIRGLPQMAPETARFNFRAQ
jgi:choline dehydrogenase